jgi:hypothetical protein
MQNELPRKCAQVALHTAYSANPVPGIQSTPIMYLTIVYLNGSNIPIKCMHADCAIDIRYMHGTRAAVHMHITRGLQGKFMFVAIECMHLLCRAHMPVLLLSGEPDQ